MSTEARHRGRMASPVPPLVTAAGAIAAVALVAAVDPHEPGNYPTCPSLALTGLYCPGCGSLRAIHNLAHGDLVGALDMNPLLLAVVPYVLFSWTMWLLRSAGVSIRRRLAPAWVIWTVLGGIIAYWILRNIPVLEPYLAP